MTIERTSNGRYRFREYFEDALTGKRKRYSVTLDKNTPRTRKEAYRLLEAQAHRGVQADHTLGELIELYFDYQKRTLKLSTATRNYKSLRRLAAVLGDDVLINRLAAAYIKKVLMDTGKSNDTLNEYLKRLKAFLRWCYQNEYLDNSAVYQRLSYFKDASLEKKEKAKFLEASEASALIDGMDGINRDFTRFLLLTGCRSGEAIALEEKDVDMISREIRISKTYDSVNNVTTSTKTDSSNRTIYMQDELAQMMADYLHRRKEMLVRLGVRTDLLFFTPGGEHLSFYALNKYFKAHCQKTLGKTLTLHSLRHTHTSLLAENGIPLEEISRRLGHSNSKITKEIYLHVTQKQKEKANERIKEVRLLATN